MSQPLETAMLWLKQNEKRIRNRPDLYPNRFDFPDYFDMPTPLASKLSSEEVDYLQELTKEW